MKYKESVNRHGLANNSLCACVLLSSAQYITLTRIALLEGIRVKKKKKIACVIFPAAGKMWGSALCRQPAFRKPLSVSMIIILIIQMHSVVDLLIQLVYCLNKLYSSYPFKGFWAIRKPSNNHAVTVMQTRRSQHTHTHTYMCSRESTSLIQPVTLATTWKMATKACHLQSLGKGIMTERLWRRTLRSDLQNPIGEIQLWAWNTSSNGGCVHIFQKQHGGHLSLGNITNKCF